MATKPRPLYAADVKEALIAMRKVMSGPILDNLANAFTFVPGNTVLAPDITGPAGADAGSVDPPTTAFQAQTPVNLVAKC